MIWLIHAVTSCAPRDKSGIPLIWKWIASRYSDDKMKSCYYRNTFVPFSPTEFCLIWNQKWFIHGVNPGWFQNVWKCLKCLFTLNLPLSIQASWNQAKRDEVPSMIGFAAIPRIIGILKCNFNLTNKAAKN